MIRVPIIVSLKSPGEMPSYDPQWHYAGIQQSGGAKPNRHKFAAALAKLVQ